MRTLIALLSLVSSFGCGMQGPPGPAGPQGPAGPAGPAGADGVRLSSKAHCSVVSSGYFFHDIYKFSDGSVMAVCHVGDAEYGIEATVMYSSTQAGAANGGCLVGNDWDANYTGGYWDFENSGASSTAVYHDPGSAANGQSRVMPCQMYPN